MSDELSIQVEDEAVGLLVNDVIPEDQLGMITTYLTQELDEVIDKRSKVETKWNRWRRQREQEPEQETKNYPWPNASNVRVPLAAAATNNMTAAMLHKFGAIKPFFEIESTDKTHKEHAAAMSRMLNFLIESPNHIDLRGKNPTYLDMLNTYGTAFVQVPWKIKKWRYKREGTLVEKVVYDAPDVIPLSIYNVYTRDHWTDIQTMPWIAIKTTYFAHQLTNLQQSGMFENVEAVLQIPKDSLNDSLSEALDKIGVDSTPDSSTATEHDIYECYLFWDVDGDGVEEDIKIFFHKESNTIVRAEFNEIGIRDIQRVPFYDRAYSLYGFGMGWMCDNIQEEVDTLHNMRNNSIHLSSMQMTASRKGSDIQGFEFRPLANIELDDPKSDITPFKFPDISGSTFTAEDYMGRYLREVTGAFGANMGQSDMYAKTNATASGTMFLAQKGDNLFNAISKNIEKGYGELGRMILFQLVANKERAFKSIIPLASAEDQAYLQEILSMELTDIPTVFKFKIKTTDVIQTEESKRQLIMTKTQLYNMYVQQALQLYGQMVAAQQQMPQLLEPTMKLLSGYNKIMEDALTLLGEENVEDLVMYTKDIAFLSKQIEMMKDQQLNQATAQGGMNESANSNMVAGPESEQPVGSSGQFGGLA